MIIFALMFCVNRLIKFNYQFFVKVFVLIRIIGKFNHQNITNMHKNMKSQKKLKLRVKKAPKRTQKKR